MATNVDPNSPYGQQLQKQAAQYGISVDALQALQDQYPPTYTQNTQGGQYGKSAGGSYGENPGLTSALSALGALQQSGQGQTQPAQPPSSTQGQVSNDPMNAATNLGAAALQMPAIYNPTPGQIPQGSKGGVAQVASPVSSGSVPNVPTGPWNTTAGVFGSQQQVQGMQNWAQHGGSGNPADAAAIEKAQGWAPGTISQQFASASSPNPATTPNAQGQLPGTPTPTTPSNAAGSQPATPWATAPAAPSAQAQPQAPIDFASLGAHTSALEQAGKALYSHFGGDPSNATHSQLLDFHQQLLDHLGGGPAPTPFGQAPQGAANYTAGVPATGATPQTALGITPPPGLGGAPAKMATGGMVPGRGNGDTVPALLTPGEYVIPKQQAAQIFGGRAPIRMADGGFVPDDQKKTPPEVSHQRITPPGSPPPAPSEAQPTSSGQQQSSDSSSAPAAPGGGNQGYWSNMVQQAQARQALNSQGASGGGYNVPGGGYIGQSPGAGESGYMYPNQAAATAAGDVGTGPGGAGGGTANAVAGGADIASGLTSALQTAVDTYRKSIKDWTMQKQAFGNQGTPNYQNTTLQQDQAV